MITLAGYVTGLLGLWLFCDGLVSIRLYINTPQTWLHDHSIRLLRIGIGIALMIMGATQ